MCIFTTKWAKDKLHFNAIIQQIKNGNFGDSEREIIDNLEQIDVEKLYYTQIINNEKNI